MLHTFHPSTGEAEAAGSLSLKRTDGQMNLLLNGMYSENRYGSQLPSRLDLGSAIAFDLLINLLPSSHSRMDDETELPLVFRE